MARQLTPRDHCAAAMFPLILALGASQLFVPARAAAHELDVDFADGCCTAHYVACDARPSHPYPPCRRGRRGVDVSSNFSLSCIGVGCIGPSGACAPLLPDATCVDSDGDALLDSWETTGYDANGDGTIDVDLASLSANPSRKDVFLEVDCLVSDGNADGDLSDAVDHSHCPRQDAIRDVVQSFADAPVTNVDGTRGVQLHVDVGSLFGAGVVTPVVGVGGVTGTFGDLGGGGTPIAEQGNQVVDWDGAAGSAGTMFSTLRAANFNANRAELFRYNIFAHQCNARRATNDCTSGWAEDVGCNDFMVTLGGVSTGGAACWGVNANGFSVGSRVEQAGTLMHELGHCLGLDHGGSDAVNGKPHYLSVMNYNFQSCTVPTSPTSPAQLPGRCDYSRNALPPGSGELDELSLDECVGIDGNTLGFGPVDWDGDGLTEGASACSPNPGNVSADINGDDVCITAGANATLNTPTSGDDVAAGNVIRDGVDRTCNSTALPDDVQQTVVGTVQPNPLAGFNDWGNILYGFQGLPSFATGVAFPVDDEPDPETIARSRAELAELMRPVVDLQLDAPATILPGQALSYAVSFRNPGRGPALELQAIKTDPGASSSMFGLSVLQVGQTATTSIDFEVPADACPQQLSSSVEVIYKDFADNTLTTSGQTSVEVLDVVPPEIACNAPAQIRPPNTPLSFQASATDHCSTPNVAITSYRCYRVNGQGAVVDHTHSCRVQIADDRLDIRNSGGVGMIITWTVVATDPWANQSTFECSTQVVR